MVVVSCLCAAWCDTCTQYRAGFLALADKFPAARFRWIDIEDEADEVGDLEVENFPTIRVTRDQDGESQVLFHGTLLPIHGHLERLLAELLSRPGK